MSGAQSPPSATAHRPSAARRRGALLRAATEIVGEAGTSAATHRAIASRAGVPLATTSYFFASINELLEEATRTFTAARATELALVATQIPRGASPDEIAAIFAAALLTGDRASELAQIEAYLHAARESGLREPVAEAMGGFEAVAEAALTAAGACRAAEGARVFVALADGFVLQHLARPRPDDEAVLRDALRAMFVAFAMTAEERAAWDWRFAQSVAAPSVAPPAKPAR